MAIKTYAALAVVGWFGSVTGSVAQVVVGPQTLLPIGVAVACLIAAVAAAVKVARWVDRVENRLSRLEDYEEGE